MPEFVRNGLLMQAKYKTIVLLSLAFAAVILSGCTQQLGSSSSYMGFYYPNAVVKTDALSQQLYLSNAPNFESIQACLSWGNNLLTHSPGDGFECSTGCRYEKDYQSIICKDTTKLITKFGKGGSYDY